MKRRLTALLLAILLCLCSLPLWALAAPSSVRIAANDAVVDGYSPIMQGGYLLIPADVFTGYFGCRSNYDGAGSILTISRGARGLYFSMDNGTVTDASGGQYTQPSLYQNGQFYVPADFTARNLGLEYSYISSTLVRVKDSRYATLTDKQLLDAYRVSQQPSTPVQPSPPVVQPSTTEKPEEEEDEAEKVLRTLYLTFTDCPNEHTQSVLNTLSQLRVTGVFFLNQDMLTAYPTQVVSIVASGHTLGINLTGDALTDVTACADYLSKTNATLKKLVKQSAWLVREDQPATAEVRQYLAAQGYLIWGATLNSGDASGRNAATAARSLLDATKGIAEPQVLLFHSTAQTAGVLSGFLNAVPNRNYHCIPIRYYTVPAA